MFGPLMQKMQPTFSPLADLIHVKEETKKAASLFYAEISQNVGGLTWYLEVNALRGPVTDMMVFRNRSGEYAPPTLRYDYDYGNFGAEGTD